MNRPRSLAERPRWRPSQPTGLSEIAADARTSSGPTPDATAMRWLALYLPALSLQLFERSSQERPLLAVSENDQIIACNAAARALGVRPGLPDGAARALAQRLQILPRRPAAERAALQRLAAWALGFSDLVSLDLESERPAALVLEAQRSLRLFGGAEALHQRLSEEAGALGWRVRCVLAPTPLAALLLAKAGHQGLIPSWAALRQALADLPPALLISDRQAQADLASMGVRSIGALLRLPRAGLAERFGLPLLQRIERLLGERADPRRPFEPPAHFHSELELPAEILSTEALLFPCRRLVDELGAFLAARQSGVQRLHWQLLHAGAHSDARVDVLKDAGADTRADAHADIGATRFQLGSAQLERDPARWLALLRERLERLRLPQPVRGIAVESEALCPLSPTAGELLGLDPNRRQPDSSLLDRLRARLGEQAVRGLALVADHRPEHAWRWTQPAASPPSPTIRPLARAERPLWLLPEPLLLERRNGRPWLDGPLQLAQSCERIETGWWDGFEIARDYYIATNRHGERLWIYREIHGQRRWLLHGFMGLRPLA